MKKQVKQTYFGVITDTLESNYSFEGLDTDDFAFEPSLSEDGTAEDARAKAREAEEKIRDFYLKAAGLSEGLMADVPRIMKKVASKHDDRLSKLS